MSAGLSTLDLPPSTSNGFTHASVHKMPSSSTMGMEDEDEDINFGSPEEEIAHYREKYRQAMDMLTETRAELEEFQQSSRELEDEMEQELASNDKQQAELKERIKRLEVEKEEWKSKQIALQKLHSSTTAAMQREMDNLRSERDKTLVALRDLEMGNDELERNERVAVSSLLDLESKYNRAIEEKTLLEQEVVQQQELEEECQRLKDEMRDANNEISILRDQLARSALPTPPSSVSETVSMSPVQEASREISVMEDEVDPASIPLPPPVTYRVPGTPQSPSRRLPRSATSSSIPFPGGSPVVKRFNSSIPQSPTLSSLSRSTTSRNLVGAAGPQSPALSRSRSGIPQASPARMSATGAAPGNASHQQTKSRGFKLLHDLQARLKATDDKLGVAKVPRRNVSNPLNFGGNKSRTVSAASSKSAGGHATKEKEKDRLKEKELKAPHARVTALAKTDRDTPQPNMTSSSSNLMSPNGWVLVGDGDGEDTPTGPGSMTLPDEPQSPLDPTFGARAVSSASTSSQRSLPSRPGIPSPLANIGGTSGLNKSTGLRNGHASAHVSGLGRSTSTKFGSARPPSRTATMPSASTSSASGSRTATSTAASASRKRESRDERRPLSPSSGITVSSRPMSPSLMSVSARPMSPSMVPQMTRSMRAPSPSPALALASASASASTGTSTSRPSSRVDRRISTIGKGPPPSSHRPTSSTSSSRSHATAHAGMTSPTSAAMSASTSTPGGLRRSTRRSSLGAAEANFRPTGIPAPRGHGSGNRTPVRPSSVHVFGDTPPPVPRIPSALLKGDRKR